MQLTVNRLLYSGKRFECVESLPSIVRPGRVHSRRMSLLSKYFTPSISATLCCLLLLFTEVVARRAVRNSLMQLNARSAYHPLHDLLAIGDNPSEDIRANIFLNMEGL